MVLSGMSLWVSKHDCTYASVPVIVGSTKVKRVGENMYSIRFLIPIENKQDVLGLTGILFKNNEISLEFTDLSYDTNTFDYREYFVSLEFIGKFKL